MNTLKAVLFDIDGTLVDSNDAHANAWVKAFAEAGIRVEFQEIRCAIGMGGNTLMPAVADIEADSPRGQRISERRSEIFKAQYLPQLRPFRDAGALVSAVQARHLDTVAASSAKRHELEALLKIAGAELDVISDDLCPAPGLGDGSINLAKTHAKASSHKYAMPNQYENEKNVEAHFRTTGPEIWRQTEGRITHLFVSLGTCGTASAP